MLRKGALAGRVGSALKYKAGGDEQPKRSLRGAFRKVAAVNALSPKRDESAAVSRAIPPHWLHTRTVFVTEK